MKRSPMARTTHRLSRGRGFAASQEQRRKVECLLCAFCGSAACDPAHLTPRSLGGCDHPDCVIPLCRAHHRAFDLHQLDLEPVLARPEWARERAHMASHMSLRGCIERLGGTRSRVTFCEMCGRETQPPRVCSACEIYVGDEP